jgi:nucleoside-diphosphate-sugar epimerase
MNWHNKKVIVTGGAGFIGSAMVDGLLREGAEVLIVDKLLLNVQDSIWQNKISRVSNIYKKHGFSRPNMAVVDLANDPQSFELLARRTDVVFHLSAVFGGREFVDTHQAECSKMLAIDHNVIQAAHDAGVGHVHYASSACVYPPSLNVPDRLLYEDDILTRGDGWQSSDNLYGFAKLMGEMQLKAFHDEHGLKSSACRYLTVYGPGELDSTHAIGALIERALAKEDPFTVWGSGNQERGFTYVDDIVRGSIRAAERIEDATPVNLGWDKRYKIADVAKAILDAAAHYPKEIFFDKSKPEGPRSRALSVARAKALLGWEPKVDLAEGLRRTVEWHITSSKKSEVIA